MNTKKPTTLNNISAKSLVATSDIISPFIAKLDNEAKSNSEFPDPLKMADIRPIHKNDETTLKENYRPVSILPSISKFFERDLSNCYARTMEKRIGQRQSSRCPYHELLIAKLQAYGFDDQALSYVYSYLSDRKQRTKVNVFLACGSILCRGGGGGGEGDGTSDSEGPKILMTFFYFTSGTEIPTMQMIQLPILLKGYRITH